MGDVDQEPLQSGRVGLPFMADMNDVMNPDRAAIGGEGTPYSAPVTPHDLSLGVSAPLQSALQGTHAADVRFECFLGVAIGVRDRFGRFAQVVEVTEWVGQVG